MNSKHIFLFFLVFVSGTAIGQIKLSGIVSDVSDTPLKGVTLVSRLTDQQWVTGVGGGFSVVVDQEDTIVFRALQYAPLSVAVKNFPDDGRIILSHKNNLIDSVILVYTGFQRLEKDQITGAVDVINEDVLNRTSGPDFLSRIEGLSPALQFNKGEAAQTDPFLIRGRTTIMANAQPLIILDDFPYEGSINDINPNDIASVTILKDAAAASIWGARAGNGVIVVKTKEGNSDGLKVEFKADFAIEDKPNLQNLEWIKSADYIEFEKLRFDQGAYDNLLNGPYYIHPITPVVELLFRKRSGSDNQAIDDEIERLKNIDVRKDMSEYLYQKGFRQQYHSGFSGRTSNLNYMFSSGYFNQKSALIGEGTNRLTLRSNNSYSLNQKLDFKQSLQFIRHSSHAGANEGYTVNGSRSVYPYASLVDINGRANNLYLYHPKAYIDTIGGGHLLDWTYNPVRDIASVDNLSKSNNLTTTTTVHFRPITGLTINALYQYQHGKSERTTNNSINSYYTRNMINQFSYINNGEWVHPVPYGGILDYSNSSLQSHQGRLQVDFSQNWSNIYQVDVLGGYEIRNRIEQGQSGRYYGYHGERMSVTPTVDYINNFILLNSGNSGKIPAQGGVFKGTDNFLSWFGNMVLSFKETLFISASVRKDEANLFGVASNAKGAPFWSSGIRWDVGKSRAFDSSFVDKLSFRTTYGVNGNVSRSASANTTIQYVTYASTGLRSAILNSPANRGLRWEKIKTANFGVDFSLLSNRISGSVDFYLKDGSDLLSQAPVDPTKGIQYFFGNVASMNGRGWDIALTTNNIRKSINWITTLNLSYTQSYVKEYFMPTSISPTSYLASVAINPVLGRPLYAVFSYPWHGLDPNTGNPQGYLNGEVSADYQNILTGTKIEDMIYNGPLQSPWFGSLRNDFMYRNLGLSINMSFKFGGFFRTQSLNNIGLLNDFTAHSDYSKRWQTQGDELVTNVPSIDFTANEHRNNFYKYSNILVQRSDNIRLEDLLLHYTIKPSDLRFLNVKHLRVFLQLQDLNVVWLHNDKKVDPYYNNVPRKGSVFLTGINVSF